MATAKIAAMRIPKAPMPRPQMNTGARSIPPATPSLPPTAGAPAGMPGAPGVAMRRGGKVGVQGVTPRASNSTGFRNPPLNPVGKSPGGRASPAQGRALEDQRNKYPSQERKGVTTGAPIKGGKDAKAGVPTSDGYSKGPSPRSVNPGEDGKRTFWRGGRNG
jgi:hypothetical protein